MFRSNENHILPFRSGRQESQLQIHKSHPPPLVEIASPDCVSASLRSPGFPVLIHGRHPRHPPREHHQIAYPLLRQRTKNNNNEKPASEIQTFVGASNQFSLLDKTDANFLSSEYPHPPKGQRKKTATRLALEDALKMVPPSQRPTYVRLSKPQEPWRKHDGFNTVSDRPSPLSRISCHAVATGMAVTDVFADGVAPLGASRPDLGRAIPEDGACPRQPPDLPFLCFRPVPVGPRDQQHRQRRPGW